MKLIIDIPDDLYNALLNGYEEPYSRMFSDTVKNGTPLEDIKVEIQKALDEDRATDTENAKVQAIALMWVLEVIDKYIEAREEK